MDISSIMIRLGESGVTVILKVDHERSVPGGRPWTAVLSGPGVAGDGFIRTDSSSMEDCILFVLGELKSSPGEWEWLDEYIY